MISERLLRTVLWCSEAEPGSAYVAPWPVPSGYRMQGSWVGVADGQPARARYRLALDAGWSVLRLGATWSAAATTSRLRLQRDDAGRWWVNGEQRPDLAACVDVGLAWTPLTNTLPIRRLGLAVGEPCAISAAYIAPPRLAVVPDGQRYTRLGERRWRYESLDSDFTAEISVDGDGLVLTYPPLFRRAAAWPPP